MKLLLSYDASIEAWTLRHEEVELRTPKDIDEWRRQVGQLQEKLRSKRGYLLVDLTGFTLGTAAMETYGATIKELIVPLTLGIIRYGGTDRMTSAEIHLQALANRFPANIFPERASALKVLEKMRRLPLDGTPAAA